MSQPSPDDEQARLPGQVEPAALDELDQLALVALRRLLFAATDADPDQGDTAVDAALELVDRLDRLEEQADRIGRLETLIDPSGLEYEQMDRQQKVAALRQYLIEQAQESSSEKASANYKEVRAFFDGFPAVGTAYDLMESAANSPGFEYQEREGDNNRLTVDLQGVNDARRGSGGE